MVTLAKRGDDLARREAQRSPRTTRHESASRACRFTTWCEVVVSEVLARGHQALVLSEEGVRKRSDSRKRAAPTEGTVLSLSLFHPGQRVDVRREAGREPLQAPTTKRDETRRRTTAVFIARRTIFPEIALRLRRQDESAFPEPGSSVPGPGSATPPRARAPAKSTGLVHGIEATAGFVLANSEHLHRDLWWILS